jgi:hypothetical protein
MRRLIEIHCSKELPGEDRSTMNATFLLNDESHAATFDVMWKAEGISGIPGHRSVWLQSFNVQCTTNRKCSGFG